MLTLWADYHFNLASVVINLQIEIKRLWFCIKLNKSRCILQINMYICSSFVRPEVAKAIIQPSEEVSESAVPSAVA